MLITNRRQFLGQLGAGAILLPELLSASQSPGSPSYDLLIAGGRVVDPSQNLSADRDVAVSNGRIARIDSNIPSTAARRVFDARGKIVTPGIINMHAHVYIHGMNAASDPERVGLPMGVTTIIDAGSVGVEMFRGFRKFVIERSSPKIYVLLNIASVGLGNFLPASEIYIDPRLNDPKAAIRVIEDKRDVILGIKVRPNGVQKDLAYDLETMKKAREAADATGLPIMMHWSNEPQLLALLKRGDILTHPFNAIRQGENLFGGDGNTILPQIHELKDRGIWTDAQLAAVHHEWEISEKAIKARWFPDAISTDVGKTPETPFGGDMPDAMSRFLYLGASLEQVVERVTTIPGKMLKYPERIGTLEPGTTADVAIFDLVDGQFELRDARRQLPPRIARKKFVPVAAVKSGKLVTAAAGWM